VYKSPLWEKTQALIESDYEPWEFVYRDADLKGVPKERDVKICVRESTSTIIFSARTGLVVKKKKKTGEGEKKREYYECMSPVVPLITCKCGKTWLATYSYSVMVHLAKNEDHETVELQGFFSIALAAVAVTSTVGFASCVRVGNKFMRIKEEHSQDGKEIPDEIAGQEAYEEFIEELTDKTNIFKAVVGTATAGAFIYSLYCWFRSAKEAVAVESSLMDKAKAAVGLKKAESPTSDDDKSVISDTPANWSNQKISYQNQGKKGLKQRDFATNYDRVMGNEESAPVRLKYEIACPCLYIIKLKKLKKKCPDNCPFDHKKVWTKVEFDKWIAQSTIRCRIPNCRGDDCDELFVHDGQILFKDDTSKKAAALRWVPKDKLKARAESRTYDSVEQGVVHESLNGKQKIVAVTPAHDSVYKVYSKPDAILPTATATHASGRLFYPHHHWEAKGKYYVDLRDGKPRFEVDCAKAKAEVSGALGTVFSIPFVGKASQLKVSKSPPKVGEEIRVVTRDSEKTYLSTGIVLSNDDQVIHDAPTIPGDCGAPYINSQGTVCGFHMFGSVSGNGGYLPGFSADGFVLTDCTTVPETFF
jgi:hypothetical protein